MRISRFDTSTRILHWSHAIFSILLLSSGIGMFFTPKSLLGDPLIKMVHLYASLPLILLPSVIYFLSGTSTRNDIRELLAWNYNDIRWFIEFLKRNKTYVPGKFNGGQKANFLASLLLISGLSLSGFVIWMKSIFSRNFVEFNFLVHDFFAVLATMLLVGHIIFTLYFSASLSGIIYGEIDTRWAREHYPDWFSQVTKNT